MIPANTEIWIVAGVTDLRRGLTGLRAFVQTALEQSPLGGSVYIFRGPEAIWSRFFGTIETGYVFFRRGWTAVDSCGRRPRAERCR
jgi:hypothetical protein